MQHLIVPSKAYSITVAKTALKIARNSIRKSLPIRWKQNCFDNRNKIDKVQKGGVILAINWTIFNCIWSLLPQLGLCFIIIIRSPTRERENDFRFRLLLSLLFVTAAAKEIIPSLRTQTSVAFEELFFLDHEVFTVAIIIKISPPYRRRYRRHSLFQVSLLHWSILRVLYR